MTSIKVPPLGESIVEATISRWLKKEGDAIAIGDTLVELETDKITVEVPALVAGVLGKLAHNEGDVVKVDEVLGEIDEKGPPPQSKSAAPAAAAQSAAAPSQQKVAAATVSAPPPAAAASSADVKSSPAARRVAAEQGVDIAGVSGTGRGGVVSKPDVVAAVRDGGRGTGDAGRAPAQPPARPTSPVPPSPATNGARETREKMSTRRRRIA